MLLVLVILTNNITLTGYIAPSHFPFSHKEYLEKLDNPK